jgi:hypothetical protein
LPEVSELEGAALRLWTPQRPVVAVSVAQKSQDCGRARWNPGPQVEFLIQ